MRKVWTYLQLPRLTDIAADEMWKATEDGSGGSKRPNTRSTANQRHVMEEQRARGVRVDPRACGCIITEESCGILQCLDGLEEKRGCEEENSRIIRRRGRLQKKAML